MSQFNSSILVEMDAIFDTRLGVITQKDLDLSVRVLKNGWVGRMSDDMSEWDEVDKDWWEEAYSKRDNATIINSRPTNSTKLIHDHFGALFMEFVAGPGNTIPKLVLNTYPYSLNSEEKETLLEMCHLLFGVGRVYELVHLPPYLVTPMYLKDGFDSYFCYNSAEWMKVNLEKLANCPIPHVSFFYPAVWAFTDDDILNKTVVNEAGNGIKLNDLKLSPFEIAKITLQEHIRMESVDIEYFCATS